MKKNPLVLIDAYKFGHHMMYPPGTEFIYDNFTPRHSRIEGVNHVVAFGIQYLIKEYLIKQWNEGFFNLPKDYVMDKYIRRANNMLGKDAITYDHISKLHDLGYLPLKIKALPEGTLVPMGVPMLTVINTHKDFGWLPNYTETLLSAVIWKPCTSAMTAYLYRKEFERHCKLTGYDSSFINWQGHNFSARGDSGIEDGALIDGGHLLSFTGSDTVWGVDFVEEYYNADSDDELVSGSVCATEHSVSCINIMELETRLMNGELNELIDEFVNS